MSRSAQTYSVIQFGPEAKAAIENGSFNGSQTTTATNKREIAFCHDYKLTHRYGHRFPVAQYANASVNLPIANAKSNTVCIWRLLLCSLLQ
jgi:hypothetical protein